MLAIMLSTSKKLTLQTVYPCSNGRYFATYNLCGKTKFVGTFSSKKDAKNAVEHALKGRSPKKSVCYY